MELAWTHTAKEWGQHCQTRSAVDTARPQKKKVTKEHPEERSGVRNGDSRIQVQLEEDAGGSSRQNWTEIKWSVAYVGWERQCFSQVKPVMWSETVGLRTKPVWDQKIGLGLGLASCRLGLAHCGLGLGLAVLVLFCETRSCNARRHNDLEWHSNF